MPYQPAGVDPWYIPNPDPTRRYRWLSDSPEKLGRHLRSYGDIPGYTLVTPAEAAQLGFSDNYINTATGRVRYGFNVLGSIPVEEYHRRVREKLDDQADRVGAVRESFMAAVDGIPGITPTVRDPEEHFDRKEFATRPSMNRVSMSTPRPRSPRTPSE